VDSNADWRRLIATPVHCNLPYKNHLGNFARLSAAELDQDYGAQMAGAFDNIHPGLSQEEAIRLLTVPVDELESQSDPYMAAAHLINFPGPQSEEALLALVQDPNQEQPRKLARRKAVEVLGRLKSVSAIPDIGHCLKSDDPYLVENAAFALQQLNCQDKSILQVLRSLLADSQQNRRVVIQSLAGLGVKDALPEIQALQDSDNPGLRGAAISANVALGGSRERLDELQEQFFLPNQMDRQSSIQDAMNAKAAELLPKILQAPVSPVFRMRALRALWPSDGLDICGMKLTKSLDCLLWDRPDQLLLVHAYDQDPSDEFLIQEFFGTDFSRSYLALRTLCQRPADRLWPLLEERWHSDAHNDYGAHYFFMRLFGSIVSWPSSAKILIQKIMLDAIATQRPQFMKSKPAAVLAMDALGFVENDQLICQWLNPEITSFWECRYAALMVLSQRGVSAEYQKILDLALLDPEPFVVAKATDLSR
jgi:bilin biosynthesis protein